MKKFLVVTVLALFLTLPVIAATTDFVADANITVEAVDGDVADVNMIILNGSTAESWIFSGGTFTVTNPGTFKVGSSNSSVLSIKVNNSSGTLKACANNTSLGTSYVTLPTTADTYTVYPSTTSDCSTLCATQTGASTYYQNDGTYTLPTCGVATCSGTYTLSAASASTSTTCNPPAVSGGGGGVVGGGSPATPA